MPSACTNSKLRMPCAASWIRAMRSSIGVSAWGSGWSGVVVMMRIPVSRRCASTGRSRARPWSACRWKSGPRRWRRWPAAIRGRRHRRPPAAPARRSAHRRDRMSSRLKSSSRMLVAPAASAAASSSRSSTSICTGTSARECAARSSASRTPPAAAIWFSLIRMPSHSPRRWLAPPPTRTAYFCARRKPGSVLRVSSIAQPFGLGDTLAIRSM